MAAYPAIVDVSDELPDGVYLDLPDAIYFAQPRLGSSDLMKLHKNGLGWWWSSRYNPDKTDTTTAAMNYGSALHALMLEGMAAYETRFAVEPDPKKYAKVLRTIPEYKAALAAEGFDVSKGTSGFKAADWLAECAVSLPPEVVCWENVLSDFEKSITTIKPDGTVEKMPTVSAVEDRNLRIMYSAAIDADGPEGDDIREILGVNLEVPSLAELAFFWTDHRGIKRRAKFDKPVPSFTMDLKSLGNWNGRKLIHGISEHILRENLDVQVGDQQVARVLMHRMIAQHGEAVIHGGTEEERLWIRAIAERNMPFRWGWLFYQKPDPTAGRAPVIFPLFDAWGGPYHTSGLRKSIRAIDRYVEGVTKFGLHRPWTSVMPSHYTDETEARNAGVPPISHTHFGWDEDPLPDEDAFLDASLAGDQH